MCVRVCVLQIMSSFAYECMCGREKDRKIEIGRKESGKERVKNMFAFLSLSFGA